MWSKADELLEQSERQARLERKNLWREAFLNSLQLNVSSSRAIVRHVSHLLKVLDQAITKKGIEIKNVDSFCVNPDTGDVVVYDYCLPDSNVFIPYSEYSKSEVYWLSPAGVVSLKEDEVRNIIAGLKTYVKSSKLPIGHGYTYRFFGGYVHIHLNGPYSDVLAKISLRTGKVE